ncbi:LOW QUALITY PROTEIN: 60S acidic ribosomal protein P2 [Panthera tigris]|uniref:LOW QUALITY PROTEIN: 60S acidic ribosomal protein P2 n=1 Tax=Panthera tigris TaxID=9694 RepID=UPI001C6F8945|nr:LOW QUALITY PROTEIN: 60S acidic ribosomal protein P2 [Panthera tigris]
MCYITSYLLASLRDNASPSAKYIKKILDSVGIKVADDRLNKVISELNGKKNIENVTAQGSVKLVVSMLTGGTVTVSAAPGSAVPAAGSNTATAVEKRDDKKKSKEWDVDMGSGLFH